MCTRRPEPAALLPPTVDLPSRLGKSAATLSKLLKSPAPPFYLDRFRLPFRLDVGLIRVKPLVPFPGDWKMEGMVFITNRDWQIAEGTNGLVPVGTTGEKSDFSHKEHSEVVEWCVEQARGRVPIIAGAGSNSIARRLSWSCW